jgi:hypothetical protein
MWWAAWKKKFHRLDEVAMSARASRKVESGPGDCPHPNDVDRKRIERALAGRERYRYVTPAVRPAERGYRIESPCCSRNIDENGGTIDIARIEYVPVLRSWRLYRRNHLWREWEYYAEYATLAALLSELNRDQRRAFWQ